MNLEKFKELLIGIDIDLLIEKNMSPKEINKELLKVYNRGISAYLIETYLPQSHYKKWNEGKWNDVSKPRRPLKDEEYEQVAFPGLDVVTSKKSNSHGSKQVIPITNPSQQNQTEHNENVLDNFSDNTSSYTIKDLLETIIQNQYRFGCELTQVKVKMDEFISKYSTLHETFTDNNSKFIDIFSSENHKTSINLNKQLKKELEIHIGDKRGIHKNDSKLINTALLIALLNEKRKNK
jgi:hypothetical protein